MQQGRGGMGSRKHGKSGRAPKSPRLRHRQEIELRKAQAQKEGEKTQTDFKDSISELFGRGKRSKRKKKK